MSPCNCAPLPIRVNPSARALRRLTATPNERLFIAQEHSANPDMQIARLNQSKIADLHAYLPSLERLLLVIGDIDRRLVHAAPAE